MSIGLRARPRFVVFDARRQPEPVLAAVHRLKKDSYTAVVPCAVLCGKSNEALSEAFDAGADEVIRDGMQAPEANRRLTAMLIRSERDLIVHPSTRLAGTSAIETEIGRRLALGDAFAVCYADLDHFKEFNDRYSYNEGDRVIRILAKLLHDVVKGTCGEDGFIGHIGGDDFVIITTPELSNAIADAIQMEFDAKIREHYNPEDLARGHITVHSSRQGGVQNFDILSITILIVTNVAREIQHSAQVADVAKELKKIGKAKKGSCVIPDRRSDGTLVQPVREGTDSEGL